MKSDRAVDRLSEGRIEPEEILWPGNRAARLLRIVGLEDGESPVPDQLEHIAAGLMELHIVERRRSLRGFAASQAKRQVHPELDWRAPVRLRSEHILVRR